MIIALTRLRAFHKKTRMKRPFSIAGLALILFAASALSLGSPYHIEMKCELKRLEVKRNASQSTETAEEKWGYTGDITNHSFKEIPDLRADYIIFSKHEKFGSTADAKALQQKGSKSLGPLANNGKASFETDAVTLKKARLKADWYYSSGAKSTTKDGVAGIWVRVYSGNDLVDEFTQPSSLKTQEKWED